MYIYFVESSGPCKTNITVIESITSNVEDETKCVFIDLTTCPAPLKTTTPTPLWSILWPIIDPMASQSLLENTFSTKSQFVVWYKCLNSKPFSNFYIYFSINCTFKVYIFSSSQTTETLQFQWTIACHRHNAKAWPNRESGERRRFFALVQFSLLFLDLQSRCLSFFCKLYYL